MARRVRRWRKRLGHKARPRLCVFRSLNNIYAQVIDDVRSHTLAAASSLELETNEERQGKIGTAALVGSLIAQRAKDKGVTQVVFDRGRSKYHGRVKALAEAARESGLEF
jgi:large subunit ribosomal protein L18